MLSFADLALSPALRRGVDAAGFTTPTPIQAGTLPAILDGRDLIAQAPTGSGKTAAFGLGLLQRLDPALVRVQALVLCPTRELADQVAKEIRRLATGIPNVKLTLLTGGVALGPQLASLEHAPHVVVGTPGRVQELLRKDALVLDGVRTLVLDEADRMLDMGFEAAIRDIVRRLPRDRQGLLFSATWPEAIRGMAAATLRDPVEVSAEGVVDAPEVEQRFHEVDLALKPAALAGLLLEHRPESTVVFCNTKRDVDDVAAALARAGFASAALHGDLEQRDRDEVLVRFANRSLSVLVASDVAARGLDVKELACVVNYELPSDPDVYVHRIGRTARAGRSGLVLNLVTPREIQRAHALEERQGAPLHWVRATPAGAAPRDVPRAPMATLRIDAGRTDKLRPGDVLGALTGAAGLKGEAIGKIDIFPTRSYVAVHRGKADAAAAALGADGIKGRRFRIRRI
ncbi:ATP-dependent RNA helicase DbpA [Coralloluteibacterium stylophorae]|uniref:ATP-dependent RNA helicase DbpA n=1 Tax=Coralloluteibacterium stylophorae TaxID=1776034 RepID=A0A8J7VSQ5_9GAMM|nr:ATP-dependent RNA helicase DbpA [Coralloluteibacterium stylophorae]MBS7455620.1 ATP-dependent RNA helicase DbpA [Coralloluteibacterium stylophorae]